MAPRSDGVAPDGNGDRGLVFRAHGRDYTSCMSNDVSRLYEEAMKLEPSARAALAGTLIDSLDDTVDEGTEAAWRAEIQKRVKELDSGERLTIPWDEARRTIAGP